MLVRDFFYVINTYYPHITILDSTHSIVYEKDCCSMGASCTDLDSVIDWIHFSSGSEILITLR